MSIVNLQRGIAEAGRIRIGVQVPIGQGRTRPEKLDTFRLTSADKTRIEQAAELFGGEVKPWKAPAGAQWEVITTATALDVIVPPSAMAFSQHYELWSAGGCQRRCDGEFEQLTDQQCICDPEERACDIHTRLSVMIRDLPGLALWRIDTQGYYAARELAGAVEILTMAAGRGLMLPARLLLEQRTVKRPGEDGKPRTFRFAVPRLDPGVTPGELLLALPGTGGVSLPQLVDGERPKLTPVPSSTEPVPSIAAQSEPPAERPARRNSAPAIPPSGRTRATAKQPGDPGYWRSRTFAEASERGISNDALRGIAARMVEDPDEDSFSMSGLDEVAWERLHGVVIALQAEGATETVDDEDDAVEGTVREIEATERRMDRTTLLAELERNGIDRVHAIETSKRLYPGKANGLTDVERGALFDHLVAEQLHAAEAIAL